MTNTTNTTETQAQVQAPAAAPVKSSKWKTAAKVVGGVAVVAGLGVGLYLALRGEGGEVLEAAADAAESVVE